ncbi:MAG: hypothetical protein KDA32_06840 [Phycisphaerales bacterium]|nr:hypothetical protein [Phycisphaerales bacterium]
MGPVQHVELELDRCEPVAEFGLLAREHVLLDVVGEAQVQQAILLRDDQ